MASRTKKDPPINVYWAPAQYDTESSQWNLLYSEPRPVSDNLFLGTTDDPAVVRCPAARAALKNVYSLHSSLEDKVNLQDVDLSRDAQDTTENSYPLPVSSRVSMQRLRRSSYKNHINVAYNLGWLMFSDEPLEVRFLPPYYPSISPTPGAIMSTGQFDIGQWYRPMNLDYHIPYDAKEFIVKEDQPLAFLEFKTERPIAFHRYQLTPLLNNMAGEFVTTAATFGPRMSMKNRYKLFKKSNSRALILTEIKKSLVE